MGVVREFLNAFLPKSTLNFFLCWMVSGFLLTGIPSFAQNASFLNTSGGYERVAHRDRGMSPLKYAGSGFFIGMGFNKNFKNWSLQAVLNFGKGMQKNKYGNSIHYYRGSVQGYFFYHKKNPPTNKLLWGWSSNNSFSHRFNAAFVNFKDHYEYITNFGPAAKYLFPFQIKGRDLIAEGVANIQLFGIMIRPSYTSSYPEGFLREHSSIFDGLAHSVRFYHPGNAWHVGFKPQIHYPLKSGNRLSLGYQYEFYQLKTPNTVTQSSGIWFVSLSTRL